MKVSFFRFKVSFFRFLEYAFIVFILFLATIYGIDNLKRLAKIIDINDGGS